MRNRGHLSLSTPRVERIPRTTTVLSRTSETAPAPRVVYQRRVLDTRQCEAPETTVPLPEGAELTFPEGCSDELLEDEEPVELEGELAELDEVSLDEAVELADADALAAAVLPGMVDALTAASTPTPATAATAAPVVMRFNRRIASSRLSRAWIGCRCSITSKSLRGPTEPNLGKGLEVTGECWRPRRESNSRP